ncbi:hypothetical protein QCD60_29595 [Pokkaliibacter sp. MBI-7]|uniref:hypothetical protein n=1 Tax=Pokkaliibacter sp. MBI-7 TaxID=3040600 RepID=UPI002448269E|nr:hypothetical protein [Pokkaliibacter sp. MBI-7]MDH2434733.1 hypothetical protein [Pokkaliibacter sp. MBI-7]MDH2436672.1 hypothetical protein [Pokkaliibacter sp. MBI-7]
MTSMRETAEAPVVAAVAAIEYALQLGSGDDGLVFLRCWSEGEFDVIRAEWPEAPEEVFGADPLYKAG